MLTSVCALLLAGAGAEAPPDGAPEAAPQPAFEMPRLRVRPGISVYGRYRVFDEEPHHAFDVARSRVSLDVELGSWLEGQIDFEVSEAPGLRDGVIDLKPAKWLRFSVGQFKKPFSRVELTSRRDLPLYARGLVNSRLVEDYGHGDRDIGVSVHGKLGGARYELGVFNGSRRAIEIDSGKDVVARVTYDVLSELELGASGSLKVRNVPGVVYDETRQVIGAAGIDAALRRGPVEVVAEILWAQEGTPRQGPDHLGSLGGIAFATWAFELSPWVQLAPVAKVELLDADLGRGDDLTFTALVGANLHLWEIVRVMVQGEGLWREAEVPDETARDEYALVAMVALDAKVWLDELMRLWVP